MTLAIGSYDQLILVIYDLLCVFPRSHSALYY